MSDLPLQLNMLRKQLIEHLLFGSSMIGQLILFTLMSAKPCIESTQARVAVQKRMVSI